MPVYEFWCETHGPFEALRAMADFAKACPCPDCGADASRVLMTPPRLASAKRSTMAAHAVNERAADSPKKLSSHGPGCACCSGAAKPSRTLSRPDGAKSFPSARPWMISH